MSKNGIRYSEECKQQMVDLYQAGSFISYLSREYGVANVTIYKWIKESLKVPVSDTEVMSVNVRNTEGILLHSDLGVQYTSQAFETCLKERGILHSFSRKGNPYDNACIKSFHSILKKEEVN